MASADGVPPESKGERIKRDSRFLRGTIEQGLSADSPGFERDDVQVLKFHGVYQQRLRNVQQTEGPDQAAAKHQSMVRVRIPGGRLTAIQFLELVRIADELGNGTLRATSRQGLQYHGVVKPKLKALIERINRAMLTTLGACGDVSRNVMVCPAPAATPARERVLGIAEDIARELSPATGAYHEIWLDGKKAEAGIAEEPFYGARYLPRKFKVGLAMPGDNCIDVFTHDLGIVPVVDNARLRGANLLIGGGLGMTHSRGDTFARLGSPLGFVAPEHVVEAVRTVAALFRDHGNRADRRHARLKYLVEQWGVERCRAEFESRAGFALTQSVKVEESQDHHHLGRHDSGDGTFYYGVYLANGRIGDQGEHRLRSALQVAVEELQPNVILTPQQNMLLAGLTEDGIERLERILDQHRVPRSAAVSPVRSHSLACVALPTCGLAITESERVMPALLDEFEGALEQLGLGHERINLRVTGCPNGCARPCTAEIAFVGRKPGRYDIFAGGSGTGDRLVGLYAEGIPLADLVETIRPLLLSWRDGRQPGEPFGDYYQRAHCGGERRHLLTGAETPAGGAESSESSA
ncbi:MAG: NADPH-dependent assimilatory sulfite reductase hemoprotein subunit [bacterium]|nr:NADPH-dependent assimilatory sulfite reductase hemoprotein subunit [bacterium]